LSETSSRDCVSPKTLFPGRASKTPRIKVKASAQSISIIIPEGVQLPIVTTIEPAGPFDLETQMFSFRSRKDKDSSSSTDSGSVGRQKGQRNVSEDSPRKSGRDHGITSKSETHFPPQLKQGRLNVSEASNPAPQSSSISVPGEVFIPPHEHSGGKIIDAVHYHPGEIQKADATEESSALPDQQTDEERQSSTNTISDPAVAEAVAVDDITKDPVGATGGSTFARPPAHLFTQSESAVDILQGPFANFGPPQPYSIPSIKIHRPSGTVVAASLGTAVMNSANVPATPAQSEILATLASGGTALPNPLTTAIPTVQSTTSLAPDVSHLISAATSALSLPLPGLPVAGKIGKKKKIIQKTRKVVLRKRILSLLLGRQLAKLVHSQLDTVGNVASAVPVPVDGPSDMLTGYARRTERKRDAQRRDLDQRIAAARIHAEAEEVHRCRICRGLTRTTYLRRYHRLQLKRDRPDMSAFDRRATALARVAAFKCKCTRRLLGVENELAPREAAPSQHLRAPAAIEAPLAGVDEAQQQ
jgi:hypothetical protein